jgi:putative N6-adenine-specific DNA methylase
MLQESFVATTLFGLENVLYDELKGLGAADIKILRRAVRFKATNAQLYKLNLSLRTALRILLEIKSFRVRNEKDLYDQVYRINWPDYFTPKKTISVSSSVHSELFTHSHYVALKTKDAIVDKFRNTVGLRPSIDTDNPDININIHISDNQADISLDSSGLPLFKRGYRYGMYAAPLNEVLAAGLIKLSGWDGDSDFYDPMCGSGTLAIEAALIAKGIPPGIFRESFAFQNWKEYDPELFNRVVENSLNGRDFRYRIFASDIASEAIQMTKENVRRAKLEDLIEIKESDFKNVQPPEENGVFMINPPYGERMGDENIAELYSSIGDVLKNNFTGFKAWVLSSNIEALKYVGLKPSKKIDLMNAKLKCKFCEYEIFKGKRKDFLQSSFS